MLRYLRFVAIAVVSLGLSCVPITTCACTYATFGLIYGDGPGAGTASAWDRGRVDIARATPCDGTADFWPADSFILSANGQFREVVVSGFGPGDQCVRVVFFETMPGTSDSLFVDPFVMTFYRPGRGGDDSTLVVLPP